MCRYSWRYKFAKVSSVKMVYICIMICLLYMFTIISYMLKMVHMSVKRKSEKKLIIYNLSNLYHHFRFNVVVNISSIYV